MNVKLKTYCFFNKTSVSLQRLRRKRNIGTLLFFYISSYHMLLVIKQSFMHLPNGVLADTNLISQHFVLLTQQQHR